MSTQLKHRRGTTTQHATFTGAQSEFTHDTSKNTIVVHDGATAGGFPMARQDGTNASGTWGIGITGNAATASSLVTTNWTIVESGGSLLFKYGGVTKASLGSDGTFTAAP